MGRIKAWGFTDVEIKNLSKDVDRPASKQETGMSARGIVSDYYDKMTV